MLLKFNILILSICHVLAFEHLGTDKEKLDFKTTKLYFDDFIQTYNKNYEDDTEYQQRHDIFVDNLMKINKLNNNGNTTYGITEFTDLKHEEFLEKHTCFKMPNLYSNTEEENFLTDRQTSGRSNKPPSEFSWVEKGVVSSVKDQLHCNTCWTFSAIGTIEGQVAKKHGKLYNLSEQQLVDCTKGGNCKLGGNPVVAFKAFAKMGGVLTEKDYPYDPYKKRQCHADMHKAVAKVIDGNSKIVKNEDELKEILYTYGPVSVGMHLLNEFESYKGGVYVPTLDCNQDQNHAILLVGYGYQDGVPYWLIKNSWGTTWGDQGFGKIIRGHNDCGIASFAMMADVQ